MTPLSRTWVIPYQYSSNYVSISYRFWDIQQWITALILTSTLHCEEYLTNSRNYFSTHRISMYHRYGLKFLFVAVMQETKEDNFCEDTALLMHIQCVCYSQSPVPYLLSPFHSLLLSYFLCLHLQCNRRAHKTGTDSASKQGDCIHITHEQADWRRSLTVDDEEEWHGSLPN